MYPYIITDKSVSLVIDGTPHTVADSHPNFHLIRDHIREDKWDAIPRLVNVSGAMEVFGEGSIKIRDGKVFWNDYQINNGLTNRILQMMSDGFDVKPLVRFMDNLMNNPSERAVEELYIFLEHNALPITSDGYFLAYKKVNDDYLDYYTRTFDNSIGKVCEVPRNMVDEDRNRTCSRGLHFCSVDYLRHYHGTSGHVMVLKINPADVVSIPKDYNNAKGRCCKYEVVGEYEGYDWAEGRDLWSNPVVTDYDYDDDYYGNEEDGEDWGDVTPSASYH